MRVYPKYAGHFEVHFSNLDFSGPSGRGKLEEILILDNGRVNDYAHYINGNDQVLFDAIPTSFSCMLEDTTGIGIDGGLRDLVYEALTCRYADNGASDATWESYGTSTKGSTQNKAGVDNPRFNMPLGDVIATGSVSNIISYLDKTTIIDETKYWVDGYVSNMILTFTSGAAAGKSFQIAGGGEDSMVLLEEFLDTVIVIGDTYEMRDNIRTVDLEFKLAGSNNIVWVMHEVYFPPNEITLSEAEDGVTLAATGGIYGTVTRASDWVPPSGTL